jgi:hypothetical protein
MEEKETLQKAREIYVQQFRSKADELRPFFKKISSLDQDIGDSTDLVAMLGEILTEAHTSESIQLGTAGSSSAKPNIRPDAFVGDTYSIAAKKYLKQVGYAVPVDELVDVLKKGGCPVGGVDPRKTLYISLVRDVRTFYPIPGKMGFIGLREFYPNLKGKKPGRPRKQ